MARPRDEEYDELKARFTAFMKTLVFHAKMHYIAKQKRQLKFVSLDSIADEVAYYDHPFSDWIHDFEFEEMRMANVFSSLGVVHKEMLRLLFVEEMSPAEVAATLNCSVGYVYNQKSKAIKKLRMELLEEENDKAGV